MFDNLWELAAVSASNTLIILSAAVAVISLNVSITCDQLGNKLC